MATPKAINYKTKLEQEAGKRAVRLAELVEWQMYRAELARVKILWLEDKPVELTLDVYVEKKHKKRINREIGKVMEKFDGQGDNVGQTRQASRKVRARRAIR